MCVGVCMCVSVENFVFKSLCISLSNTIICFLFFLIPVCMRVSVSRCAFSCYASLSCFSCVYLHTDPHTFKESISLYRLAKNH